MAKKNTAHRPSQSHMEYVTTRDGRKVKNTAYVGSQKRKKSSSSSVSQSFPTRSRKTVTSYDGYVREAQSLMEEYAKEVCPTYDDYVNRFDEDPELFRESFKEHVIEKNGGFGIGQSSERNYGSYITKILRSESFTYSFLKDFDESDLDDVIDNASTLSSEEGDKFLSQCAVDDVTELDDPYIVLR